MDSSDDDVFFSADDYMDKENEDPNSNQGQGKFKCLSTTCSIHVYVLRLQISQRIQYGKCVPYIIHYL